MPKSQRVPLPDFPVCFFGEKWRKHLSPNVKKAFEKHMKGEGFCLVELLSPCPTNLNMTPVKSVERIKNEMIKYFPLGEFKDKKEEE